jgi:hypothetical protein
LDPYKYPAEFNSMKKDLNDFNVEFLIDFYYSGAPRMTNEIKGLEKDIRKNKKDTKKARKESNEVASGLQAKNISMQMENDQAQKKIEELAKAIIILK